MFHRSFVILWMAIATWQAAARPLDLGPGKQPDLACGANGLHLVYESLDGNNDIYYRHGSASSVWSQPVNLSHSPGISSEPAITLEASGAVDVVWSDTSSGNDHPDIYFARSADGGQNWSEPVDVSQTPRLSTWPKVTAAADGSLAVVWMDTSRGLNSPDLYGSFSSNHGQSWSKPELVSGSLGTSSPPALGFASDSQLYLAWCSGETRPRISYRRGQSQGWSSIRQLAAGQSCSQPVLAVAGNQLHLGWIGQSSKEMSPNVYHWNSRHRRVVNVSRTPGTSSQPSLALTAGNPVLTWIDTSAGAIHPDVWIGWFGRARDLSQTPGISRKPSLAAQGHRIWVVWEELDRGSCHLKLISQEDSKR